jgi:hypothetical protein
MFVSSNLSTLSRQSSRQLKAESASGGSIGGDDNITQSEGRNAEGVGTFGVAYRKCKLQ